MVKIDLTDEEKQLIIEALNNNIEPPLGVDDKTLFGTGRKIRYCKTGHGQGCHP